MQENLHSKSSEEKEVKHNKIKRKKKIKHRKKNVKLVAAAAAKIMAAVALEMTRRKKSIKNARQKKIKYLNILKKIKVILGRKQQTSLIKIFLIR